MSDDVAVRLAAPGDAAAICAVINPIIARGGTTAHQAPWAADKVETLIRGFASRDFMHVAEASGRTVGFQFVEAHPELDADTGDIASFVALEAAGAGVGRALADATFAEARRRGWTSLFAYIRADNAPGLAYYERIGFRTVRVDADLPLADGTRVDRVAKLKSL